MDVLLWAILGLAAALRFFRILPLVEFLGDQGRTSSILFNWFHSGAIPLSGPTTLTGQHLGPMFYYLLAPFYFLGGFHPLALSIGMVLYGLLALYVLYVVIHMVYGRVPALWVALLYAVGPTLVHQDRIIWEPNLVPLFGFLFAYFAIRQHEHVSFWNTFGLGAVSGILIQLHYPNLFFLGLGALLFVGHSLRVRQWHTIFVVTAGWFAGFILVLFPFLIYEFGHSFSDIVEILQVIHRGSIGMGKRQALLYALDYGGRVFGYILPGTKLPVVLSLLLGWCVFFIFQFSAWNIFWTCWFGIGLLIIARYNGVVYDHYLLFLLPPVALALGSFLSWAFRYRALKIFLFILLGGIVVWQLTRSDIREPGVNDLTRTSSMVSTTIADAHGSSYAFTLVSSRSFSDLHYRYFFQLYGAHPTSITANNFQTLYVLCDSDTCPTIDMLLSQKLPVICFDPHCEGSYPQLDLAAHFDFKKQISVPTTKGHTSQIYVFSKK